jgi:5-(carboxyamino)imidazole ribonucleotide mutase
MTLKVAILQGSKSDESLGSVISEVLKGFEIDFEKFVISAHRNPELLDQFCKTADEKYALVIAVAGLSAALPGAVAARVKIPVVGVPAEVGPLNGVDALLSMAQMPSGVPVATMGIGVSGAKNAAHFALRIIELLRK